jgi:hypothetical protein
MAAVMNVRRKLALAVAAAAVAVPALSACSLSGFDYATDRPNTIANGGYYLEGPIQVMAARIVAPSDGVGTFIATITVDPTAPAAEFDSLEGVDTKKFTPVEIKPNGIANLYTEGGIPVTGDFKAGQSVPVTLGFSDGTRIKVNAIVVTECHEYGDPAVDSKSSSSASADASESASAAEADATEADGGAYSCDYAAVPPLESEH